MDIKQYAKDVCNYFDNLSDEEFNALLICAGIEKCPYDDIKQYAPKRDYQLRYNIFRRMFKDLSDKEFKQKLINDGFIFIEDDTGNFFLKEDEVIDVSFRLEEALNEVKLIREGKLPKRTWDEIKGEKYE